MEATLFDMSAEDFGVLEGAPVEDVPVVIAPPKLETLELVPSPRRGRARFAHVACQAWREGCHIRRAYRLRQNRNGDQHS